MSLHPNIDTEKLNQLSDDDLRWNRKVCHSLAAIGFGAAFAAPPTGALIAAEQILVEANPAKALIAAAGSAALSAGGFVLGARNVDHRIAVDNVIAERNI